TQRRKLMRPIKRSASRRAFVATGLASGVALALPVAPAHSQDRSPQMSPIIRVDGDVTTLINTFTVDPENQQKLVDAIKQGTEALFSKMPGFVSSSVHVGKTGRQVVNYSQWRSTKDIETFRQNPYFGPYIQNITALAKGESIVCDVAFVRAA